MKIKSITNSNPNNLISFSLSRKNGLSDPIQTATKNKVQTEIKISNLNSHFKLATAKYSQEAITDSLLAHCLLLSQ